MKRLLVVSFTILVMLLSVFLSGYLYCIKAGNISLVYDGKEVLNENVLIDATKYMQIKFIYGSNVERHYKKSHRGSPLEYLRYLDMVFAQNLERLKLIIDVEKIEPSYDYLGDGKFAYYEGKQGIEVDLDSLALEIILGINSNTSISVPYKYVDVVTTYTDLVSRTQKLASFSTNYQTSSEGRKNNVKVATERLNNAKILSGETMSFNAIVGERTESNGFSMAKIIQNGEFIEGVGGGVCQVSTTLFNACLLSGLEVTRSATHSLPVSYVAPSLDAMVSSSSDLIVKNNSPYTMYIYGHCDGKKVSFEVFGCSNGYFIKLRSVKIRELLCEEYDIIALDPIPDGMEVELVTEKKPISGLVSESYRDYFNEKGLVYTERLRRSIYAPQRGIKYKRARIDD